jgi:ligand-binding sensor domain-containing protein
MAEVTNLQIIGEEQGLFDPWLHLVLEDDQGRLWMSSNRGIFWIRKQDLEALVRGERDHVHSVVYTEQDGLLSVAGNGRIQPAGQKGRDGRMWFPTEYGLAVIDPAILGQFSSPGTSVTSSTEMLISL